MRLWDALFNAMGMSDDRRIGPREAEQLLDADSNGSAYPELSRLLASAAAPARADELIDLRAAVAAFEAADQDSEFGAEPGNEPGVVMPRRRRVLAGSVGVKAVAGIAVVAFGGAAFAAETGSLPSGAQQHAHEVFSVLGVPPPTSAPAPPSSPVRHVTGSPSTGDQARTPQPAGPAAPGLCRSWQARQKNPKGEPMKAEAFRALATAAGGAEQIATFCASVLAGDQGPATTNAPTTVVTTPSRPGNGKGHAHPTPTPNPHKNG